MADDINIQVNCSQCGNSIVPLNDIHVSRRCNQCDKTIYLKPTPSKTGTGIDIQAGESLSIPTNIIEKMLNLDNLSNPSVHFTREGISHLVHRALFKDHPNENESFIGLLKSYQEFGRKILDESPLFKGVDFDNLSKEDADALLSRFMTQVGTLEWNALGLVCVAGYVEDAINEKDVDRLAWGMSFITKCHAMTVYKQQLEDVLWRGYLTGQLERILHVWEQNKQNSNEEFWQKLLENNSLLLSHIFAFPIVLLKDKAYVGGKSIKNTGAKILDFLLINPISMNVGLVEIKTPVTDLLGNEYRTGVYSPHPDLSGAVMQVLSYKDKLTKSYHSLRSESLDEDQTDFRVFNPHCVVIAGNFNEKLETDAQKKSFDLYRTTNKDVQIVTFDELFAKVKGLHDILGG